MNDITLILESVSRGDKVAAERLLPLVYKELRSLAARRLAREKPGQTLEATALVHEAYLRLLGPNGTAAAANWASRGHFFAAAAEAMRRILIDNARRKNSLRGGGGQCRVDLPDVEPGLEAPPEPPAIDLLALDEALTKLERVDPRRAAVVKLRFFAGLSNEDAAGVLGVSPSTADNDWAYARCWLRLEMGGGPGKSPGTSPLSAE